MILGLEQEEICSSQPYTKIIGATARAKSSSGSMYMSTRSLKELQGSAELTSVATPPAASIISMSSSPLRNPDDYLVLGNPCNGNMRPIARCTRVWFSRSPSSRKRFLPFSPVSPSFDTAGLH